jgi:uncharacterized membrane protein YfcA
MTILSIATFLESNWYSITLFFLVAILYASVGFGGGSSYLAILAFAGVAYPQMRVTALLCNILVVSGNVFLFYHQKIYDWKKIIPLIICSIPMAFIGGFLKMTEVFFFILLGFTLFFAGIAMWFSENNTITSKKIIGKSTIFKNTFYGGFIGFLSGMVGIGGGIFLAPFLHLTNWDASKKIAATASLFILVNSLAGILGQSYNATFSINWNLTSILLITVFIGGQIGNRLSYRFFTPIQLKKATAILVIFVSVRILLNL